jgi:putative aldouronate transport system permease protein
MNSESKCCKKRQRIDLFDIISLIALVLFAISIFYPFYNAVLTSFVTVKQYMQHPAMLIPQNVMVDNYKVILSNPQIFTGYKNTLVVVVLGTCYSLGMNVCMAYAFSRKAFPGKRLLFMLVLFTMFFSGGLIPLYLLVKSLGMMGKLSSLIFVHGLVPFFMIILKNGFEQVPESIEEAAKIEGANDIAIFVRIMLPIQLAMLATFTLFICVDFWNEWFLPMLFIKDGDKFTLQVVLRSIIYQNTNMERNYSSVSPQVFTTGIKIAAVVVTMLPIMLFYPFLQKYFVKGVMVGAIKM